MKTDIVLSELVTGEHVAVRLNETHRTMYIEEHKLVHKMYDHKDYHHYFLHRILKKISNTGM